MRSILVVAMMLLPLTAGAGIKWKGEFDGADLSEWDSYQLYPAHWSFPTASPTPRSGSHCAKAELHNEDTYNSAQRVEISYSAPLTGFEGSELFYAWSAQLDSAEPLLPLDLVIAFFESTGGSVYHQMFGLHVDTSHTPPQVAWSADPENGNWTEPWTGTMTVDVWHDFVLHVKWSLDDTVGFYELYMDGTQVISKTMMRTMVSADGTTAMTNGLVTAFHTGILLAPVQANKPVEAVYLDRFLIGDSMSDVVDYGADAGMTMPPVDAGTQTVDAGQPKPDAGMMTSDAGTKPGNDAGTIMPTMDGGATGPQTDGGSDIPNPTSGCTSAPGALALLALLALARTRRRQIARSTKHFK